MFFSKIWQSLVCGLLMIHALLQAALPVEKVNIILDLNGILLDTNIGAAMKVIGRWNLIKYYLSYWDSPRPMYFDYLNYLKPYQPGQYPRAVDEHGNPLPQLMCEHQCGTSGAVIYEQIVNSLQHTDLSSREVDIITNMAQLMFDPETFVETRMIIPGALEFLEELKKDGHHVYILSNWDAESFDLVMQMFPELFTSDLIDGIMISGDVGMMKPDPALYKKFIHTFHLNAHECIFIDDQKINTDGAKKCGINVVEWPHKSFASHNFAYAREQIHCLQEQHGTGRLLMA